MWGDLRRSKKAEHGEGRTACLRVMQDRQKTKNLDPQHRRQDHGDPCPMIVCMKTYLFLAV